jgi:hypothetical protein
MPPTAAKGPKGVAMGSIYKRPARSCLHALISLFLLLSPGLCPAQIDPYWGDPGVWQITATAVDTGAIAAAELGTWSQHGTGQFVVVRVAFKSESDLSCAPFTARLEVSTGIVYAPGGKEDTGGEATDLDRASRHGELNGLLEDGTIARQDVGYSIREKALSYAFKVNEGEKPVALIVKQRPDAEAYCRSHYTSFLPSRGPQEVRLPLEGLPTQNNLVVLEQSNRPLRLGQLQIVTTAVATTSRIGDEHHPGTAAEGHHFVVISVGIRNVGKDPNCSSLHARLIVDRGYEYTDQYAGWFPPPQVYDLLPGKTTGGSYVFRVHDGTRPATLILERTLAAERLCAEKQHRAVDMTGGARLRVSLRAESGLNKD